MGLTAGFIIFNLFMTHGSLNAYPTNDIFIEQSNFEVEPSIFAGRMLSTWSETDHLGNPEEQGPYFQGDIIMPQGRASFNRPARKWDNGIIAYEISESFSEYQEVTIKMAIDEIASKTCIKLIPYTNERDFLIFKNDATGCWSKVGRVGGPQTINLQGPCLKTVGTAIHEILHAIGLYHEQNRNDRDDFISVINKNIRKSKLINFEKMSQKVYDMQNMPYDYESVLHYSPYAFSINGKATIETKGSVDSIKAMGQRSGLSSGDIEKVNMMYNCAN